MAPKTIVTIIILSFNTKELTLRAVHSCINGKYKNLKVVVVDNASSDDTVEALLKLKEPKLKVIARDVNDGFAAGNNIALREVTTPYCMLLNSDAYIDEASDLGEAISFMEANSDCAVLTPRIELTAGKLDPASHRGFPNPWNALTYYTGLEKIFAKYPLFGGYHQTWKDLKGIHEIDACSGAAMVVRTLAMEEVGLMDEQFFMYGEDLDWCFRFKEKRWKVIFFPRVLVHHNKHTSGMKKTKTIVTKESLIIQKRSRDAFYDAMKLFYKKHYAGVYPKWMQTMVFAGVDAVRKMKGH